MTTTAHGVDATDLTVQTDKLKPVDIDEEPITLGDNPANVEGALHEVGLWLKRTGLFEPLLENRAVLLSNGKLAVESANAALFVSGTHQNADTFSFDNPCPLVNERVALFDADAALSGNPAFAPVPTLPSGYSDNFMVNQYSVRAEEKLFLSSIPTQDYL